MQVSPPARRGARPFVGRQHELAQIAEAVAAAGRGEGSLFLIVGEPGIGKTRTADQAARAAGDVTVAWGRCWEHDGAPAFWPWTQVVGALARRAGDDRDALAELIAGVGPGASGEVRFRLHQQVTGFLRRVTASRPALLVLDDLHWADLASLQLLQFVARELRDLPLVIVCTYRDAEADTDGERARALTAIAREGATVALPRLGAAEVVELVGDDGAARALLAATDGNPLFLDELLRLLEAQGGLARAGAGALPIPPTVRETIRGRLDRLPPPARALLEVASVLAEEVAPQLVAAVAGLAAIEVDARLAEASAAGVLQATAGGSRFSHALVREVLLRDLEPGRRTALHQAAGDALARLSAGEPHPPFAQIAHHHLHAGPAAIVPAVQHAIRAAEQALALLAYDDATTILERARAALDLVPDAPESLRGELLLALGHTRIRASDAAAGKELCRRAAAIAETLGDPSLLARAALAYGSEVTPGMVDPHLVELLRRAEQALAGGDVRLRVRVSARLASAMQPHLPDMQVPVVMARAVIAEARQLGDPATELFVISTAMGAMTDIAPARERLPLNLEARRLAVLLGDRAQELRAQMLLVFDHVEMGNRDAVEEQVTAYQQMVAGLRAPRLLWPGLMMRALQASADARFDDDQRLVAGAREVAATIGDRLFPICEELHRVGVTRARDRLDECAGYRRVAQGGAEWMAGFWELVSCSFAVRAGDRRTAEELLGRIDRGSPRFCAEGFSAFMVVDLAVGLRDRALAARALPLLHQHDGDYFVSWGRLGYVVEPPGDRMIGLCDWIEGRLDDAAARLSSALAACERAGLTAHLARIRAQLAQVLEERGAAGDGERARALRDASAARATELGQTAVLALLERTAPPPSVAVAAAVASVPVPPSVPVAAPVAAVPPTPVAPAALALHREADVWAIVHPGGTLRLKDSRGLQILALLVASPGRELHATELAGAGEGDGVVDGGDAGELLDREAREAYRRRVADLREQIADAEERGDAVRAERARTELDFLAAELSRAVGLGGRERRAGATAERARSAVTRRVREAIRRIADLAPDLGVHLERCVRTGVFCCYDPSA